MQASAANAARMAVPGATAVRARGTSTEQTVAPVDYARDTVTIAGARTQYRASLRLVETEQALSRSLLDCVG